MRFPARYQLDRASGRVAHDPRVRPLSHWCLTDHQVRVGEVLQQVVEGTFQPLPCPSTRLTVALELGLDPPSLFDDSTAAMQQVGDEPFVKSRAAGWQR